MPRAHSARTRTHTRPASVSAFFAAFGSSGGSGPAIGGSPGRSPVPSSQSLNFFNQASVSFSLLSTASLAARLAFSTSRSRLSRASRASTTSAMTSAVLAPARVTQNVSSSASSRSIVHTFCRSGTMDKVLALFLDRLGSEPIRCPKRAESCLSHLDQSPVGCRDLALQSQTSAQPGRLPCRRPWVRSRWRRSCEAHSLAPIWRYTDLDAECSDQERAIRCASSPSSSSRWRRSVPSGVPARAAHSTGSGRDSR